MKTELQSKRRLLTLAGLALLTPGCARIARYQAYQKVKEERNSRDLTLLRSLKTVTVLAPKTDKDVGFAVLPSTFATKEHMESIWANKPGYIKAIYASMTNQTLSAEFSDAVARRLENLGYTVKQVFSDELMNDSQTISEAPFDTDFTYAVTAPQLAIVAEPITLGPDHYFLTLGVDSTVAHARQVLSLGMRGRYGRNYYLFTEQWDYPAAVRNLLTKYMDEMVDRLFSPIEPA
ncbi:hypothetical protein [Ralstonia sp. UBA689]|uniref:hypothetical protein n=1 Tax=Ralstonia sp. UBA689 TaxID=1947373 RepID=UPI0025FDE523|nr:hypothetical protein [Ralstonia sp. UBA689]